MSMTASDRVMRASIAGYEKWGRTPDRAAATAPARDAFMAKFEAEVRAEFPEADDATVARLAESRRRAHFQRLALRSARARRARRRVNGGGSDAT